MKAKFIGAGLVLALSAALPAAAYAPRQNILQGHSACSGYTVDNYMEYYNDNQTEDPQLHAYCATAYTYYDAYLNAIDQGYSQEDSDKTYEAFKATAELAIQYYEH